METSTRSSMHPLIAAAAVSVILFSLVGIGALTGLIPTSHSQGASVPSEIDASAKVAAPAKPATSPASESKPAAHKVAPKRAKPVEQAKRATHEPVKVAAADSPVMVSQNAYPPAAMTPPPNAMPPRPVCRDCGMIESMRTVEKNGQATGSGAAIGGIAGGILGNQTGRGNGRTAMTVLGAIGGALAGNQIEKSTAKTKSYEIDIRFEDGSTRLITQDTPPIWRSGDRVRVQDGIITANNAY